MPVDTKEIPEEIKLRDEANLKKLNEVAKAMILKFTHDKLGMDEEAVARFFDNTEFFPDYEMDSETMGEYNLINGKIGINSSIIQEISNDLSYHQFEELLNTIGTIIHEEGHKFSWEWSKARINKQIEEGFADLFADECIGYFLEEYSEELAKFGFDIKYINRIKNYFEAGFPIHKSSYDGEADFTRSSLVVIKQKKGEIYTTEYEYIFGDKEKFIDIAVDAMGDGYRKILEEQREDFNLGKKYNYKYNKMLFELLKDIQIKEEKKTKDSRTNVLYIRQNMINEIIRINKVKAYAKERGIDIYNLHPEEYEIVSDVFKENTQIFFMNNIEKFQEDVLAGYIRNCKTIEDLSKFDISIGFFANAYPEMLKSGKFTLKEILEYMSERDIYSVDDKNAIKILTNKIIKEFQENRLEGYSRNELLSIIKLIVQNTEEPNKELFDVVQEIDKRMPNKTEEEQIEIGAAKLTTSRDSDGNILDSIIAEATVATVSGILLMKDRPEKEINDYSLVRQATDAFEEFLTKNAKNNPEALKQILVSLQKYEEEVEQGKEKSEISKSGFEILKNKYFNYLEKDLKFLETNHCEISDELKEYIKNKKMIKIPVGSNIDMKKIINVHELLFLNHYTKLINVFNKNNLINAFENSSIAGSTRTFFYDSEMSKSDMSTYIKALTEYTKHHEKEEDIQEISEYIKHIDTVYKPTKEKETSVKEGLMEAVKDRIQKREHPEQDIERLLQQPKDLQSEFVFENAIGNLESKVNSGDVEKLDEDTLKRVTVKTKDQYLQEICLEALKQKYITYAYTTSSFISNNTGMREAGRKAYLMSLGKENDKEQAECLETLDRIHLRTKEVPINPQYVKIDDDIIIISKNSDKSFKAYSAGWGEEQKTDSYLAEEQNRRKKGIFALFKSKEDKEMVVQSIVIQRDEDRTKVINLYETGRFEITTLDTNIRLKHPKVIEKKEAKPIDIGNNGALVVKDSMPKQFVKHQSKLESRRKEKDKIQETDFKHYLNRDD